LAGLETHNYLWTTPKTKLPDTNVREKYFNYLLVRDLMGLISTPFMRFPEGKPFLKLDKSVGFADLWIGPHPGTASSG
jgi:hypothetical protein